MTLNDINVEELYSKESFVTALNAATSPEDIKKVFGDEGITVNDDEAKEIYIGVTADLGELGELSEEALDSVAGGSGLGTILAAIITAGGAVSVGTGVLIVGGVVFAGATAITAFNTYKRMKNK